MKIFDTKIVDGKTTLTVNYIHQPTFGANLAHRIGRAISDLTHQGRTLYNLERALKRHHIDLFPRYRKGESEPYGLVFGIYGGAIGASTIASQLTWLQLKKAGFRYADTAEERRYLDEVAASDIGIAMSDLRVSENRLGLSPGDKKKLLKERERVIGNAFSGQLDDGNDTVTILQAIDSNQERNEKGHLPIVPEAHTKSFEALSDGTFRLISVNPKEFMFYIPHRITYSSQAHMADLISKMPSGYIIGGTLADRNVRGKVRKTMNTKFEDTKYGLKDGRAEKDIVNDLIEQAKAVKEPKPLDLDGVEQVQVYYWRPGAVTTTRKRWIMIDVDDQKLPPGCDSIDRPEEAAKWYIERALPPEFCEVRCQIQQSSSAGFEKREVDNGAGSEEKIATWMSDGTKADFHLFFELDTPMFPEDVHDYLAQWAAENDVASKGVKLDLSVLRTPNQPHFVEPPRFPTGVEDPLPRRWSTLSGEPSVTLPEHVEGLFIERAKPHSFFSMARRQQPQAERSDGARTTRPNNPLKKAFSDEWVRYQKPGRGEVNAALYRQNQALWHAFYRNNPFSSASPADAEVGRYMQNVERELRRRAEEALQEGRCTPGTVTKLEQQLPNMQDQAISNAYREHGVPTPERILAAPADARARLAERYRQAARAQISSLSFAFCDPRTGERVLVAAPSNSATFITEKGSAFGGPEAIAVKKASAKNVYVTADAERVFKMNDNAAGKGGVLLVSPEGVSGRLRAQVSNVLGRVGGAFSRMKSIGKPGMLAKPTVHIDDTVPGDVAKRLEGAGYCVEPFDLVGKLKTDGGKDL